MKVTKVTAAPRPSRNVADWLSHAALSFAVTLNVLVYASAIVAAHH